MKPVVSVYDSELKRHSNLVVYENWMLAQAQFRRELLKALRDGELDIEEVKPLVLRWIGEFDNETGYLHSFEADEITAVRAVDLIGDEKRSDDGVCD